MANRIVLLSRSGRVANSGQGLEEDLQWLQEQSGVEVLVRKCDVSDEASLVTCLDAIRDLAETSDSTTTSVRGSIRGIVHSAGVLRDAMLRGGKAAEGCKAVWSAKAHSAQLLHKHTLQDDLAVFVTFSSITSAIGNPGQTNYTAANAYQEGLIQQRRMSGLVGHSIRWPAIMGVG